MNSSKKLLAIVYYYPPDASSGSIRNLKLLKELSRLDWKIRCLTINREVGDETTDDALVKQIPITQKLIRTYCFYVVDFIIRLRDSIFYSRPIEKVSSNSYQSEGSKEVQRKSKWQALKDFVTDLAAFPDSEIGWLPFGVAAAFKSHKNEPFDLIYAVGKPWTSFLIGYILKIIIRRPLIIDFMDPWTTNPFNPQGSKIIDFLHERLEKFVVKKADFIIANTVELKEDFRNRLCCNNDKLDIIPCGFDKADFAKQLILESYPSSKMVITHIGTFYGGRNPYNFLIAIKRLLDKSMIPKDKLLLNFIGTNLLQDQVLLELMEDLKRRNVLIVKNWIPHTEAIEQLYRSNILLIVQPNTYLQIPAKLYEYIYTRKPIFAVAENNSAISNIIVNNNWGVCINNNDIDGISTAIVDFYHEFKNNNKNIHLSDDSIKPFDIVNIAARLDKIFHAVLKR